MVTLVNLLTATSSGFGGGCSPLVPGCLGGVSLLAMVYRWVFARYERWKLCCKLIFAVVGVVAL